MSCPFDPSHRSGDASINGDSSGEKCPYQPGGPVAPRQKRVINEDANEPIPQPPAHWLTKNMRELDPAFPVKSVWRLAKIYGDIYKLDLVTRQSIIISSHELIDEVMDEERFDKSVAGGLKEARALLGDGLFTAFPEEPNWWTAHRILMPVFGPLAIRNMFSEMHDMISQMVLKWDREGPDNEINTADDFTINRLAFDTIGFCGFSYRFNSFYRDEPHPFATQMGDVLIEAGKRASRSSVENYVRVWSAEDTKKNIEAMWNLCDELVAERKRNPRADTKDVLNTMLTAVDPETGAKLSDESIRFNMVTFLAAGHETTSGTLAFLFYHLLKNPEKFHAAQAEVDRVLGDDVLEPKHLPQLKYLEAAIRETLRCQGPISQIQIKPKKDTVIGNKYRVSADTTIQCNLVGLHHDTRVWGEDPDVFRPERLLNGGFEALPPNAWKPFGNGRRACIGRAFAEQEMLMATAMILQRFQVQMVDPGYDLRLKSTLTVKPIDFKIKVSRRLGKDILVGIPGALPAASRNKEAEKKKAANSKDAANKGTKILILYGSNAGTCKYLAEELETIATDRGFNPTVKTMDSATEHLPTDTPVAIITPSYEGKPADNARAFVSWLEASSGKALENVKYALFGVGNSEWSSTFHRIPKVLDELLPKLGGQQVTRTCFVDVREDLIGPWEDWRDEFLDDVGGKQGAKAEVAELAVSVQRPETAAKLAGEEILEAVVKVNKQIAGTEVGPAKMHMEVQLPRDQTYRAGDYLVVLPTNPSKTVNRVADRFSLSLDDIITVSGTSKEFLAGNGPVSIVEILGARVELSTPASKRQIEAIAKTANEEDQKGLLELASSDDIFKAEVITKRRSVLDLLEDYPSTKLSFAAYLDMLKPLSPRQYSISSSPLASDGQFSASEVDPAVASITYDVLEAPARSGNNRTFYGVASTYLASRTTGSKVRCFVRPSNASFHLPQDPNTPVIMVAAGTGLAPMRGFIQERAYMASVGERQLGPALLYIGCRHIDKDFLYKDQLREWEGQGAVTLRPAFSKVGPAESSKYVHEQMWNDREELSSHFRNGAKIFVCGSASKLAKSAADVVKQIWLEKNPGKSDADAQKWLEGIREERYVSDVFD